MFNILTDRLPDKVNVDGEICYLKTDFKIWIIFETVLAEGALDQEQKLAVLLPLCLKKLPSNLDKAVKACLKFYRGNEKTSNEEVSGKPLYSFMQDAEFIFSAFMSQYGIDLTTTNMHWYKFRALFKGLSPDNKICEIMQIRSINLSDIKDPEVRKRYRTLKNLWQLPDFRSEQEKEEEFAQAVGQLF